MIFVHPLLILNLLMICHAIEPIEPIDKIYFDQMIKSSISNAAGDALVVDVFGI